MGAYKPAETVCSEPKTGDAPEKEKTKFEPCKGKIRKPGTGGVYQINDHLYEGRFTPTNAQDKREIHTVYAHTETQCEEKLATMIVQVKAQIKAEKAARKALTA